MHQGMSGVTGALMGLPQHCARTRPVNCSLTLSTRVADLPVALVTQLVCQYSEASNGLGKIWAKLEHNCPPGQPDSEWLVLLKSRRFTIVWRGILY